MVADFSFKLISVNKIHILKGRSIVEEHARTILNCGVYGQETAIEPVLRSEDDLHYYKVKINKVLAATTGIMYRFRVT